MKKPLIVIAGPTACGKSTLLRMIGGLEETVHVAIILVGPDAEAAQLELDGHVLTALRPDKGNDTGPVDVAELQGQKDGDADDGRKQDGNENHDEVGKKEALAQRPVPELHSPHLVSLNFLLVYILRLNKNITKSKFSGESFALFKKVCYNKVQI